VLLSNIAQKNRGFTGKHGLNLEKIRGFVVVNSLLQPPSPNRTQISQIHTDFSIIISEISVHLRPISLQSIVDHYKNQVNP
jgi:hypothetical protein